MHDNIGIHFCHLNGVTIFFSISHSFIIAFFPDVQFHLHFV